MTSFPQEMERGSSLEEKVHVLEAEVAEAPPTGGSQASQNEETIFFRIQRVAGKFGVEQRGIERVLPEERTDASLSKIGTLVSNHSRFARGEEK